MRMFLISLALFGGVAEAAPTPKSRPDVFCVEERMLEKVREVMLHGIDDALKRHVMRVFNTWMKDPSEQPQRAIAGIRHGVEAYLGSRKAAEKWNPPICP